VNERAKRSRARGDQVDSQPGLEGGGGGLSFGKVDGLDPSTEALATDLAAILNDAYVLMLKKHENYGPLNVAGSPGGALNGLRVRLHDKAARWNHMLDNDKTDRVGEDLIETFTDSLNYCAIAILVLKGQWPGVEHTNV